MNIGQYDIAQRGGYFASAPRLLSSVASAETEYPHDFGRPPDYLALRLTCVVTNSNWVPGESWYAQDDSGGSTDGFTLVATNGKLIVSWQGSSGGNILLPARDGSSAGSITTTSWEYQVIAHWLAPF